MANWDPRRFGGKLSPTLFGAVANWAPGAANGAPANWAPANWPLLRQIGPLADWAQLNKVPGVAAKITRVPICLETVFIASPLCVPNTNF